MGRMSLKDKAYIIIKEKIVNCEYAPGSVLVEAELMELVGASRTPIREALNKLEQERLVRIMPKRGVFVTDITIATLQEIFAVREMVEPYVIREFGHRIPTKVLEYFEESFSKATPPYDAKKQYKLDDQLHQTFVKASNNSYIEIMMSQIYNQDTRIRIVSGKADDRRFEKSTQEHLDIVEPLLAKEYKEAAAAAEEHLKISRKVAMEILTKPNSKISFA